ncbi:hypothetical protein [Enterococcus mundtii]|nr:hypothetical protein [Enterococcus mundtii]
METTKKKPIHISIDEDLKKDAKDGNIHGGFSSVDELLEDLGTSGK